ncbi:dCTP deaminase [Gloeobacter violaceus]|uniref:dCTP deaminase n=1 Tax=Gloeobacter violaceus (strain ATCC 29082 / PCC 7421) TaxID=251221 RepID=Q7MBC0_GLOVI|nr:dCTP deaminase [Gloeobacter violaceus]BAC91451.1 dCTP deaminase [Gloeobacter violaceus PCC 7421]
MLNSDSWIKQRAAEGMIAPFEAELVRRVDDGSGHHHRVLSYGLSSAGYDIRLADDEFKVFRRVPGARPIDPKRFDNTCLEDMALMSGPEGDYFILPANSLALAHSVEHFRMPDNVVGVTTCKSTYIRSGVNIPITILEPGWTGVLTLEIANPTPCDVMVYPNEGIAQVLFFTTDQVPEVTYATRKDGPGKYQSQEQRIVLPRV